mmetsp:Transcript_2579/g.7594  ORF Transcript_2579/g.7594 Transcript_2579/m.7594 type:complete len:285 (-) Transcript_2579:138-992(-)
MAAVPVVVVEGVREGAGVRAPCVEAVATSVHVVVVAHPRAQAPEHAEVLIVVEVVVKVGGTQFKKGGLCQERIAARLVLRADARNIEELCEFVEPALEVVAAARDELDVIDRGEVGAQQVEEGALRLGQRLAGEHLEEVAEVVTRVKADPPHVLVEHHARHHEQLRKVQWVDAVLLVLLEVDARLGEQVDGVLRIEVIVEAELEIELPGAAAGRQDAVAVAEGDPQLDDVEQVHVAANVLVVGLRARAEGADGPRHAAWKLRVHGKPRIAVHNFADVSHLLVNI